MNGMQNMESSRNAAFSSSNGFQPQIRPQVPPVSPISQLQQMPQMQQISQMPSDYTVSSN
jgi:hypothetical protein